EYVLKSPRHFARLPVAVRLALKRAQQRQALKEAEARYRNLFNGVPVGLYRTTPGGQALDANIALVQMLGYPNRESLLTINAADTYADPEDRQRWQVLMEREGVVRDFEAQLRRRDGTIIWVRDSARAVRDADGRVLYYEGSMEDVTERRRVEEKERRHIRDLARLSRSAMEFVDLPPEENIYQFIGERLKEIAGNSIIIISSFDAAADVFCVRAVLGVEKQAESVFEILGGGLVGRAFALSDGVRPAPAAGELVKIPWDLYEFSSRQIPEGVCRVIEKVLNLGDIYVMGFIRKGELFGSAVIMMCQGTELRNPGIVETFINQASVALQRKRAEEALRRERDFSQSIVETSSALVMVLDADGRITLFNRACEELTGYTAAETIGCVMWKFLVPERFVPGVQEAFSKRLRADVPPGNYEIPLLTRDDNERWITWTYTNVRDEAGDVTAIVGIGVDVTDFRRVQQTLERRNRELQALVEAGQLLSGTLDLDEVLDRVLDVVQKQFNLASVSFSSYDPATQTFEIRAQHYDVPAHQVGRIGERRTRDQHPYSSRALDTGQPVYEPDLWTAPHIPEEKRAEARAKNIRSVVEVPLVAKGQPVGVLHLRSFETPRFFTEEELAFVRAIAPGAAAAIDNARLYGQIDAARARAEGLAARVVQAQEEERRRIARELHDEVGQLLTGAKLSQEMLVADLPAELAELRERALENVDLIDETMDVVRKLSLDLRPAALDELGLRAALEWHIERYQHRTGLQVILRQEAIPSQLPDPLATAVYRIIQETLTNVARHASAESVVVEVACVDRNLRVQVTDDGCGFDAATVLRTGLAEGHFGLVGLQERATLLGGKARIESAPGKGTRIAVELPLPECE
ncbi:MAG: PAS domain S-box protein, partial [Anaerolineae bacterium]